MLNCKSFLNENKTIFDATSYAKYKYTPMHANRISKPICICKGYIEHNYTMLDDDAIYNAGKYVPYQVKDFIRMCFGKHCDVDTIATHLCYRCMEMCMFGGCIINMQDDYKVMYLMMALNLPFQYKRVNDKDWYYFEPKHKMIWYLGNHLTPEASTILKSVYEKRCTNIWHIKKFIGQIFK